MLDSEVLSAEMLSHLEEDLDDVTACFGVIGIAAPAPGAPDPVVFDHPGARE